MTREQFNQMVGFLPTEGMLQVVNCPNFIPGDEVHHSCGVCGHGKPRLAACVGCAREDSADIRLARARIGRDATNRGTAFPEFVATPPRQQDFNGANNGGRITFDWGGIPKSPKIMDPKEEILPFDKVINP